MSMLPTLELAVSLVERGLSYSQAAEVCDTTRNAVAGACNLAGVKLGETERVRRSRAAVRSYPVGADHHLAKLSENDIRSIRKASGPWGIQTKLARRYGVSKTTISAIVARRTWKHI